MVGTQLSQHRSTVNDGVRLFLTSIASVAILFCCPLARAQDQCGKASLNATYGFAGMGSIPQAVQSGIRYDPVSHVGMASYDGQGNVSVVARVQYQGKFSPLKFTGVYDIHGDCSGVATLKDADGKVQLVWNFVLVHDGQEIETIVFKPATPSRPMYSLTLTQKKR